MNDLPLMSMASPQIRSLRFALAAAAAMLTACGGGNAPSADQTDIRRPQPALAISSSVPGLTLLAGYTGGSGTLDGTGTSARFSLPVDIAIDPSDNVYVTDQRGTTDNLVLRKVTPAGMVTTLSERASRRNIFDRAGNRYIVVGDSVVKVTPEGITSTLAGVADASGYVDGIGTEARLTGIGKMVADQAGNLHVTNTKLICQTTKPFACVFAGGAIRKITPAGAVSTLAGFISAGNEAGLTDGAGASARFTAPSGLAIDDAGNLFVSDSGLIRRISPSGEVATLPKDPSAGDGPWGHDLAIDGKNQLFALGNGKLYKVAPSGGMTPLADFSNMDFGLEQTFTDTSPAGLVADSAGNLFVASQRAVVYKITPTSISILAGMPTNAGIVDGKGPLALFGNAGSIAKDAGGNIYVADEFGPIRKIAQDGTTTSLGEGTGQFVDNFGARGMAVSPDGTIYFGAFLTIRKLSSTGVLTTLAGSPNVFGDTDGTGANGTFSSIRSMVADSAGNLYVAEAHSVRKVTPSGVVTTLAGSSTGGSSDGSGKAAHFNFPSGIALDTAGNLIIADTENATIRKLSPEGVVTTLAGSPSMRGLVDGAGSAARFNSPKDMAADDAGNVYVIDTGTIRKVTPAGVVTTVAGSSAFTGTRLGDLPGNFARLGGITYLGANVFAVSNGTSVLKLAVP